MDVRPIFIWTANNSPNLTDWIIAVTSALLLVAAGFAAWYAKGAMQASREASEAAREANEQTRRDSIERSRPYVFAEIVPSLWGDAAFDLRIANSGLTAAYNVTFEFSDWPADQEDSLIVDGIRKLFDTSRVLPPRTSLRAAWRIEGELRDPQTSKTSNRDGMPDTGTITVRYENSDPAVKEPYVESFAVLIGEMGATPVPESGSSPSSSGLSADAKYLGSIIKAGARHIGELRR